MKKVLSICVPTYNRREYIEELLDSIYSQNVSNELFEVCITDDSDDDETQNYIRENYNNVCNLKYRRVPNTGYLNLIKALEFGEGKLLKLHNDYSIFIPGMLGELINEINTISEEETVVFYRADEKKKCSFSNRYKTVFNDFDSFLREVGIVSTWSTSFAIWKSDFERLSQRITSINEYFPHVSYLYSMYDRSNYIVDDRLYYHNHVPQKKGGYNISEVFVGDYITLTSNLKDNNIISNGTMIRVKIDVIMFASRWKALAKINNGIRYTFEGDKSLITRQCGKPLYWLYMIMYYLRLLKYIIIDRRNKDE